MYSNSHHNELEPRPVPKPTQFQEISAKPEVPELSIVFDSAGNNSKSSNISPPYATSQTTQETYSEWKNRQNHSPIHRETRSYEPNNKQYCGTKIFNDYDQNPYSRFSDRMSYKSSNEYHKCTCENTQNTPTVKDIYNMMQLQNEQVKFILETIQKLLVTVLSNQQQNHYKCCCFENNHCKKDINTKTTKLLDKIETREEQQKQNLKEKLKTSLKKDEIVRKKNETNKNSKCSNKPTITPITKNTKIIESNNSNDGKESINEKERTYSIGSDESLDLNANDVHVIEAPISPEQSIHIEMKSSSEDSSNSDCEEEKDKKIEVGWTMYKNIIGQVNNLLENNKNEPRSEAAKPVECLKPTTPITKPKNFEPYKQLLLPENNKVDSSLQMQALAMQYLSPEQAVKFDINKHFVPTTQPVMKSPNNYSISTLHYMERYHLIAPEQNYISENQCKSTEGINKNKKPSHKKKTPSKILNITELKQQPKLS